ncbi:hypothetical protein ACFX13_038889 [Malus domestica]
MKPNAKPCFSLGSGQAQPFGLAWGTQVLTRKPSKQALLALVLDLWLLAYASFNPGQGLVVVRCGAIGTKRAAQVVQRHHDDTIPR